MKNNNKVENSIIPKKIRGFYKIISDSKNKNVLTINNLKKSYYSTAINSEFENDKNIKKINLLIKKLLKIFFLFSKTKNNFFALKGINLEIQKGERVAILGANGAGKTTLMEIIAQIRKPDSGKIIYNFSTLDDPRNKIGFQFQESKYPGLLKVKDVLNFYKAIYQNKINENHIEELLEVFHLKNFLKKPISKMSGGQKQRFNVLLALFHTPELLILDELSTGLDIETRAYIKEFVKTLIIDNKLTLLLVSHQTDEIDYLCERVIVLDEGEIVYDLKKNEIIKKYKTIGHFAEDYFINKRKKLDNN